MNTIDALQGTDEWLAIRAKHFTASEAPAMMGASKYQTRTELLRQKHTGLAADVDDSKQRLFDRGHAAEAAARPIVEAIIGAPLYPETGILEIDGLPLLASFDGLTAQENIAWENKLFNASLAEQVRTGIDLEPHYHWQLEQQLLVSGAERVYFTTSDGTPENTIGMWYEAVPGRREQLIAGWKQFAEDLANYQHVEHAERPAAQVSIELPALFIQARGAITDSNMAAYGEALKAKLAEVRAIQLVSDQDFSNAKAAASMFREQCKKLKLAKEAMLAQTVSVGEAARMIDAWSEDLRVTALQLEKDVEREDKAKKAAIVNNARAEYAEHVREQNERIGGNWLPSTPPDFAEAMKNKRSYQSMHDAVAMALANAKVEANMKANLIARNFAHLESIETDFVLAPDFAAICAKPEDDFANLIAKRLADAHAKRVEAAMQEQTAKDAAVAVEAAQHAISEFDQRGNTEDATHAQPQATAAPQAPAASTPPLPQAAATLLQNAMQPAVDAIIDEYLKCVTLPPEHKKVLRGHIKAWEKFKVAAIASGKFEAAA